MSTSALKLITGAAGLIGVVFKSEVLAADEAMDGLEMLNDMLDTWSNDSLSTFAYTNESFPLTGAASYAIGPGGDFNTSRPINIVSAVVNMGGVDYTLTPLTPQEYLEQVPVKNTSSTIPKYVVYDNAYPSGHMTFYAVPAGGSTLKMLSNKPLSNISALTSIIDLPPGWKRAIRYNLAIDMAPDYGAGVPDEVASIALTALGAIRRAASANKAMPFIEDVAPQGDIYTGPL